MEGCLSFKTHSPFWRDKISRRPNFCTLCFSTVLWHLSVHPSLEQFSRVSADLPLTFLTFLKFCPHYLSKLSFMCQINENHELVLVLETWWIYWVSKTLCSCWRPPPPTHTPSESFRCIPAGWFCPRPVRRPGHCTWISDVTEPARGWNRADLRATDDCDVDHFCHKIETKQRQNGKI